MKAAIPWLLVLHLPLVTGCEGTVDLDRDGDVVRHTGPKAVPTSPATGTHLTTAESREYGPYISDALRRPLYAFSGDSHMRSACHDLCAAEWPPVPATQPQAEAGTPSIRQELIGSLLRRDGAMQVTYGGRPLYYRQQPAAGVQAHVEDRWGEWSLVRPDGELLHDLRAAPSLY